MKKVTTFIVTVIILCYPAAAYGVTALDEEAAETLTIAQASKDVYCPECGEKNPRGAAYCASCGSATSRPARGEWDRNIVAISGNAGGFFIDGSFGYVGTECAFQVADYFAFGPEFSYFFGGDSKGLIAGLEFRPYFVPYSRSTFVKPHAYFGGGYLRETVTVWIFEVTGDGGYARAGGGVDFRIPGNDIIVPYFDLGAFTTFSNGETITRVQFEGGVRFTF